MGRVRDLPGGTVASPFTDVEGSTKLLHELGAEGHRRQETARLSRALRDGEPSELTKLVEAVTGRRCPFKSRPRYSKALEQGLSGTCSVGTRTPEGADGAVYGAFASKTP